MGRIPPLTLELVALERLKKTSYNLVSTLAPSFLIRSCSFLQVWRTTIISRTSLKFGMIRPRTVELSVIECLKIFPRTYNGENLVSTLEPSFLIGFFFIFAGNEANHKSLDKFEFRRNSTTDFGVSCP